MSDIENILSIIGIVLFSTCISCCMCICGRNILRRPGGMFDATVEPITTSPV